jgi:hypothetical protein
VILQVIILGSIPNISKYIDREDLSLMVKHMPFKHQHLGSNPRGLIHKIITY